MNVFSRSWNITKLSFGVIKKDKELLWFPILAGIFSLAFMAALLFPTVVVSLMGNSAFGAMEYVMLALTYFALAFVATFFNVCVVYTTKTRFEGGDATFMESIKFAGSRIHQIFLWSLVSASVGLLLRILQDAAERLGTVGEIVMKIFIGILGFVWGIMTIFIVPVLVYEGIGPFKAIKRSAQILKKTWGESLIRHFGLGFIMMVFVLLGGALLAGLGFVLYIIMGGLGLLIPIIVGVVYFVLLFLVFNIANQIFNTALYVYAAKGKVPSGFDQDTLKNAFGKKKSMGRGLLGR